MDESIYEKWIEQGERSTEAREKVFYVYEKYIWDRAWFDYCDDWERFLADIKKVPQLACYLKEYDDEHKSNSGC